MRIFRTLALGATVFAAVAPQASAEVQVTLKDGRVTLIAKDATVRQILAEWARVGETKIVNVERIPGGPMTVQFTSVPEADVLDILLRSVSGYMAAPRPTPAANLSRYDRIMVLTTAPAPRAASTAGPIPSFQQPSLPVQAPDDADPNQLVPAVVVPARAPVFQTFPTPQVTNPPQTEQPNAASPNAAPPFTTAPASETGGAAGVPRPGMVIPPPVIIPGQPAITRPAPGR
jgi:hypothetical protein